MLLLLLLQPQYQCYHLWALSLTERRGSSEHHLHLHLLLLLHYHCLVVAVVWEVGALVSVEPSGHSSSFQASWAPPANQARGKRRERERKRERKKTKRITGNCSVQQGHITEEEFPLHYALLYAAIPV